MYSHRVRTTRGIIIRQTTGKNGGKITECVPVPGNTCREFENRGMKLLSPAQQEEISCMKHGIMDQLGILPKKSGIYLDKVVLPLFDFCAMSDMNRITSKRDPGHARRGTHAPRLISSSLSSFCSFFSIQMMQPSLQEGQ